MADQHLVYGIFKAEEKNRFICRVAVASEEMECYVPSSCRLEKLVALEGREVALRPNKAKRSRTRYALYAVKQGEELILLDQTEPNRIVEEYIHSRRFSFLGKRANIQRERTVDEYKSDLYLPETNTIIEIKSILSFESRAEFPNVLPLRGLRQLNQILALLEKGIRVCYLFVSLNPGVKEIHIGDQYSDYHALFQRCINAGMLCKGISIKIKDEIPIIYSMIPVSF